MKKIRLKEKKVRVGWYKAESPMIDKVQKKYKITNVSSALRSATLYHIVALRDIPEKMVKKGDIGGYVESEANLSHEGSCWISKGSRVFGNARVEEDAWVRKGSTVKDEAILNGHANILDTIVTGQVRLSGLSEIIRSQILGNSVIEKHAIIYKSYLKNVLCLSDNISIENSELEFDSPLTIRIPKEESVTIKNSGLVQEGKSFTNSIYRGLELESAWQERTKDVLKRICIRNVSTIKYVCLLGKSSLRIEPSEETTCIIGESPEECITFDSAEVCISSANVLRAVHLEGKVDLDNATLMDYARVENHENGKVEITNSTLRDFAMIQNNSSGTIMLGEVKLEGEEVLSDTMVSV